MGIIQWIELKTRVEAEEAKQFHEMAQRNERSVMAELRIAVRERLERENGSRQKKGQ